MAGPHDHDPDSAHYLNNSHWLPPFNEGDPSAAAEGSFAAPSNYVLYYDAASLYPSSGNFIFLLGKPIKKNLSRSVSVPLVALPERNFFLGVPGPH